MLDNQAKTGNSSRRQIVWHLEKDVGECRHGCPESNPKLLVSNS